MPRDSNGNYSLPAGNPVVTGSVISASGWGNPTMNDLASEMSDSLSRTGQGGMLVAMKFADGTSGAPGLSFTLESTSGIFRAGSSDVQMSVAGVPRMRWYGSGIEVWDPGAEVWYALVNESGPNWLLATGDATVTGNLEVTGTITQDGATLDATYAALSHTHALADLPISASGNRWDVLPKVDSSGIMEVGSTIDFHESDADTGDAAMRLASASGVLTLGGGALVLGGGRVEVPDGYGFYTNTTDYHIANDDAYGSIKIVGAKGGYAGIKFNSGDLEPVLVFSTSTQVMGVYNEATPGWRWQYDGTTFLVQASKPVLWSGMGDASAQVSRGTTAPLDANGNDGDIYLQYTA